jgi:hypothetical protein
MGTPVEFIWALVPYIIAMAMIGGMLSFYFSGSLVPAMLGLVGLVSFFMFLAMPNDAGVFTPFVPPQSQPWDWSWLYPVLAWLWWGLKVIGYAALVYLLPRWSCRVTTWAVSPPPRWLCQWLNRPLPPRPFHPLVRSSDVPPITVLPEPWVWVMEDIDRSLNTIDALLRRHESTHVETPLRLVK